MNARTATVLSRAVREIAEAVCRAIGALADGGEPRVQSRESRNTLGGGTPVNNPAPDAEDGRPATVQPRVAAAKDAEENGDGTAVSRPIGTPRATKLKKDRKIDSSLSILSEELLGAGAREIRARAPPAELNDLARSLAGRWRALGYIGQLPPEWARENRRMVVAAVLIARHYGDAGRRWLEEAKRATERRARRNPYGFFRGCLVKGLRELDPALPAQRPGEPDAAAQIFGRLVRRLPMPAEWLGADGQQRKAE